MREIKFRWFDSYTGRMTNWNDVKESGLELESCFEMISLKPMQYAGLKDKNGVEIYEGDIVDCYDEEEISFMMVRTQSLKGVVDFDSGSFGVEGNHLALICASTIEVIGNIHENGELLNEN